MGIVYICDYNYYNNLYNYTNVIINYLKENNYDYEITLIPFYNHLNNDENFYKKLKSNLNNDKIFIEFIPKKFGELISVFEKQEYIISMRYHGTLIANFMSKNVLSINFNNHRYYFNKNNYIYSNYGFNKNYVNFSSNITKENLDLLFSAYKHKKHDKTLLKAQNDIKSYIINELKR